VLLEILLALAHGRTGPTGPTGLTCVDRWLE